MSRFSEDTLVAVGEKNGVGFVGIRPPVPADEVQLFAGACRFRIDEAEEITHPDGDYTLIRAESDVESAQGLADRLAFAISLELDTVYVPIHEPVSLNEPGSTPFDPRNDFSELQVA